MLQFFLLMVYDSCQLPINKEPSEPILLILPQAKINELYEYKEYMTDY